jgi:translation initiation factor IF-1
MKQKAISMDGKVEEALSNGIFKVLLDNGHLVISHLCGKMRTRSIRVLPGDRVRIEISPYDLTKGRIMYRYG